MYNVLPYDLSIIAMMYFVFVGASIVTFPFLKLITNAFAKGVSRWR